MKRSITILFAVLLLCSGCALPTVRVATVHIRQNQSENTADVCVKFRGREWCASVKVDKISYEVPVEPTTDE